jgi:hypothetical protein
VRSCDVHETPDRLHLAGPDVAGEREGWINRFRRSLGLLDQISRQTAFGKLVKARMSLRA